MPNLDDAVNSFLPIVNALQPRLQTWLATAGDGHGNIGDPTIPNHVYVRVLNNAVGTAPAVQTISVFNDAGLLSDGDRCVIGYSPDRPRLLRVLAKQDQRYDVAPVTGTTINNTIGVLPHAWQHFWLGPDQVFIRWRQIYDLLITSNGDLTVTLQAGIIPRTGVDTVVATQTIDLSAHVPATGALYALISIDATGNPVMTDGLLGTSPLLLTIADIPDTPSGNFRLAAIRLYAGQTAIAESRDSTDIVDLRWPQEALTGGGGGAGASVFFIIVSTGLIYPADLSSIPGVSADTALTYGLADTTVVALASTYRGSPSLAIISGGLIRINIRARIDSGSSVVHLVSQLDAYAPDGTIETIYSTAASGVTGALTTGDVDYVIETAIPDFIITPSPPYTSQDFRLLLSIGAVLDSGPACNFTLTFDGDTAARLTLTSQGTGTSSGLIPLTDGHILVGNSAGAAADVAMSGGATITDTGAVALTSSSNLVLISQIFGG